MKELVVITIEEQEGVTDGIDDESLVRVTLIVVWRRRVGSRSVCRSARVCRGRRRRLLRRMSVRLQPLRTAQIHHDACLLQHSPPKLVTNSYKLVAEEPELMRSDELDQVYVAANYCKPGKRSKLLNR
jgi:hypothetical protein